jgi:tetraacyldisaccharide 4'-kinase
MIGSVYMKAARGEPGALYSLLRAGLIPASCIFDFVTSVRNILYDKRILSLRRASVPVVSIGNLTVGGTGKTPATVLVTRMLASMGHRPGIVSRGYGARGGDGYLSDENTVLSEALPGVPIGQGPDRHRCAEELVASEGVDCVVLDDGFQHRRLLRDLDILLIDASFPTGGGHLLPAGLLRESTDQVRRASLVVLTRTDQAGDEAVGALREEIRRWGFPGPLLTSVMVPVSVRGPGGRELGWFEDRRTFLFSGVGNPDSFRRIARELGVEIVGERVLRDHHRYSDPELLKISKEASAAGAAVILTTAKDWVKVREKLPDVPPPFNAVEIEMRITEGEEQLRDHLRGIFQDEPSG